MEDGLPMVFDLHQDISDSILYTTHTDFFKENKLRDGDNDWGVPVNNQTDYPRLQKAGVRGLLASSCVVGFDPETQKAISHPDFAEELGRHLDLYREIAQYSKGNIVIIEDKSDLESWFSSSLMGFILSVEGLDCMDDNLEFLDDMYRRGVRSISLTHNTANIMGGGASFGDVGLTELGKKVVERMGELGITLDLAHLGDKSFDEALEVATGPVLVSHTACRDLLDHPRNLTVKQMRAVADRGGLIGICGVPTFTGPDLSDVVNHFMTAMDMAGVDHVAIGSDFGGMLSEKLVNDFEDVRDFSKLARELMDAGLGERGLEMLFSGNAMSFFRDNLT